MRFVALASLVLAACGHPEGGSFNLARIDQNFVEIDGARAPVTFRVVGRTVAALHWELIGPGAIDHRAAANDEVEPAHSIISRYLIPAL